MEAFILKKNEIPGTESIFFIALAQKIHYNIFDHVSLQ